MAFAATRCTVTIRVCGKPAYQGNLEITTGKLRQALKLIVAASGGSGFPARAFRFLSDNRGVTM